MGGYKSNIMSVKSVSEKKRIVVSQELSTKLGVISFLSILFVLFNHSKLESQVDVNFDSQFPALNFVNSMVSAMTRLNRVLFFGIAGFLFGNGAPFSGDILLRRLQNRFWTILVPYLFSFFFICIGVFVGIKFLGPDFSSRSPMLSPVVALFTNKLECLIQIRISAGIHLWFIESLMLNVVGFGFYSMLTGWNFVAHIILLIGTAFGFISSGNIYFEGAFYFTLGTLMSRWTGGLEFVDRRIWVLLLKLASWIFFLVLYIREENVERGFVFSILRIVQSILGASLVWQAVDFFPQGIIRLVLPFAAYTFPVYLIHAPFTIGVLRHAYIRFLPATELIYSCAWFVVAILTYLASYSIAKALEFASPKLGALIFGGRGAARKTSA